MIISILGVINSGCDWCSFFKWILNHGWNHNFNSGCNNSGAKTKSVTIAVTKMLYYKSKRNAFVDAVQWQYGHFRLFYDDAQSHTSKLVKQLFEIRECYSLVTPKLAPCDIFLFAKTTSPYRHLPQPSVSASKACRGAY